MGNGTPPAVAEGVIKPGQVDCTSSTVSPGSSVAAAPGIDLEGEVECVNDINPVTEYPIDLHVNTKQLIEATSSTRIGGISDIQSTPS